MAKETKAQQKRNKSKPSTTSMYISPISTSSLDFPPPPTTSQMDFSPPTSPIDFPSSTPIVDTVNYSSIPPFVPTAASVPLDFFLLLLLNWIFLFIHLWILLFIQ